MKNTKLKCALMCGLILSGLVFTDTTMLLQMVEASDVKASSNVKLSTTAKESTVEQTTTSDGSFAVSKSDLDTADKQTTDNNNLRQENGAWGTCLFSLDTSTGKLFVGPGFLGKKNDLPINRELVKSIEFAGVTPGSTGNILLPENSSELFSDFENLTTITGMKVLNTSNVLNMDSLFYNCSSLTTLDLTTFDTSKVVSMANMFTGCSSLTTLNLTNFDTSKVTNMFGMFSYCSSLTALDLSPFHISRDTKLHDMFYGCTSLTKITLSQNFNSMLGTSLPDIPEAQNKFWVNVGNGSETNPDADHIWTSAEFMTKYTPDDADTYIWGSKGELSIKSTPTEIDFGKNIPILAKEMILPVKDKDSDLIISDTRNKKGGWRVTATILKELTNQNGDELHDVLYYGNDKLEKDSPLDIYNSKSDMTESEVNISQSWNSTEGLRLQVKGALLSASTYSSKIEWDLVDDPGGKG